MEFIAIDLVILISVVILVFVNLLKAPKETEISQELLNSFLFMIVKTDSKFKVLYHNSSVNVEKITPVNYNSKNNYCFITINNENKPIQCYTFKSKDTIYFISRENKKTDISSILTSMSITDNPQEYFNHEVKIKTILEYTGKLLNSDWVNYYTRQDNMLIEEESWYAFTPQKSDENIVHLLDFDYSQPYFFITLDDLPENRRKQWNDLNIMTKLVVPILYEKEIEKQITFVYSPINSPKTEVIDLIVGILNFIIKLKIKFEKEIKYQKQMDDIKQAIIQFIANKNIRREQDIEKMNKALQDTDKILETLKN